MEYQSVFQAKTRAKFCFLLNLLPARTFPSSLVPMSSVSSVYPSRGPWLPPDWEIHPGILGTLSPQARASQMCGL